jgi:hypothetical protein
MKESLQKFKVKHPKHLFLDITGKHPDGVGYEHVGTIGVADPVIEEPAGIPVQRPGEMLVNIIYPFRRENLWVSFKDLYSNDMMCRLIGHLQTERKTLLSENGALTEKVNRLNIELRTYKEIDATNGIQAEEIK